MTTEDGRSLDALLRRVGAELESGHEALADQDEAFLRWLAADLRHGLGSEERARDRRDAATFAARVRLAQQVQRAEKRLPRYPLREREAPVSVPTAVAIGLARKAGCAAMVDLAVAAGEGRDLWDDPCERWLELPPEVPTRGRLVALGVAGDSMVPVLDRHDVILVQLDAKPAVDDIVLARVEHDGYVVKRLSVQTVERVELASFNGQYEPIVARGDQIAILGVVVARLSRVA